VQQAAGRHGKAPPLARGSVAPRRRREPSRPDRLPQGGAATRAARGRDASVRRQATWRRRGTQARLAAILRCLTRCEVVSVGRVLLATLRAATLLIAREHTIGVARTAAAPHHFDHAVGDHAPPHALGTHGAGPDARRDHRCGASRRRVRRGRSLHRCGPPRHRIHARRPGAAGEQAHRDPQVHLHAAEPITSPDAQKRASM
jgi:hypothetical protein